MANTTIPSELIQANVALSGSPTTTTQSAGNNTTKVATTAFVTAAVNALIDSAPGTMNTLNEIAAALNDDASFNTTVTNAIATKLPLGGGTMTGNIAHASNFTIDAGGDIILDADGGDITFNDGGTTIGQIRNSSSDLVFQSSVSDKDIKFVGNDGGSDVTALTLDMSAAGAATFTGNVTTTAEIAGGLFKVGSTTVLDGSRNLTNIGTIGSGAITSTSPSGSNKSVIITRSSGAEAVNLAETLSHNALQIFNKASGSYLNFAGNATHTAIQAQSNGSTAEDIALNPYGGFVGIGTTAPTDPLTIHNGTPSIKFKDTSSNGEAYWALDGVNMSFFNKSTGGSMAFGSVNTERMRLLATGELHVTSGGAPISPTFKHEGATGAVAKIRAINRSGQAANKGGALELGGITDDGVSRSDVFAAMAGLKTNSTSNNKEGYLALYTTSNSSLNEQMRIDSGGNTSFGKNEFNVATAGTTIHGNPNGGITSSMPNGSYNTYHVYKTGSSAGYKFYVSNLGIIHSTQTTINALSDERLKENIADLETGLSEVMALKPRRFDWKNGDGKNLAGFIAQEVETVLPDLIGDFKHEELEDCKSLKMGDMVPTLVKAMQEQQTLIEALTARIETLEG